MPEHRGNGLISFQLEGSAAYHLTADQDVYAIGPSSKRAGAQIVDVLTAIYSEVRARISRVAIN